MPVPQKRAIFDNKNEKNNAWNANNKASQVGIIASGIFILPLSNLMPICSFAKMSLSLLLP